MKSTQAGVRRVPCRSRRERTGDPPIGWELINGAKGGTRTPTDRSPQDPEPRNFQPSTGWRWGLRFPKRPIDTLREVNIEIPEFSR